MCGYCREKVKVSLKFNACNFTYNQYDIIHQQSDNITICVLKYYNDGLYHFVTVCKKWIIYTYYTNDLPLKISSLGIIWKYWT